MQQRGWTEARLLVPVVGQANELGVEAEYPSIEAFKGDTAAWYRDAD